MVATTRRRFLKLSAAAMSGLGLSNCGWTLAQVRTPTCNANTTRLDIYTWSNYIDSDLLKSFTDQSQIVVRTEVFDSNEVMLSKMQAGGGAQFSVIYPSDYMVQQMIGLNILNDLDHDRLPGLTHLLPRFQDPYYDAGNRYSVPISWGTTGFIYNSEKLPDPPTDWNYLWDNQKLLSRRITLLDDVREVMGAALRMLGYSYNSRNGEELQQAYTKLSELKPAIAAFTTYDWRDRILAGDLLLAMSYSSDALEVIRENPKLKYVIPQSGTSVWTDTLVIPKTACNVDGAYAWINYMLQPEVAAAVCERFHFATTNKAALAQLPAPFRDNPILFPPESVIAKCEGIAPVGKVSADYDHYWTLLRSS